MPCDPHVTTGARAHADARRLRVTVDDGRTLRILPAASLLGKVAAALLLALLVTVALLGIIVGALLLAYGQTFFGAACIVAAIVAGALALG